MTASKNNSRKFTFSEKEFEALPPTLRRKYFSSLERLRLAQNGAYTTGSAPCNNRPSPGSSDHTNPSRLTLEQKLIYLGQASSRRLLRKSESIKTRHLASQIDPVWFSSLPQKIQQRQFTHEEKLQLTRHREAAILDSADEAVYRHRPSTSPSTPRTPTTSHTSHTSHYDMQSDTTMDEPVMGMDDSFYDSFRWLEEEDELDLTLSDYHDAVIETSGATNAASAASRPNYRRTLSLSSLSSLSSFRPRRPSRSAKTPTTSHPTTPSFGLSPARPLSTLLTPMSKHRHTPSTIDPSAQYYQDPEARLKLRVYLASPQKFDEAIEFGFPALGGPGPALPSPPPSQQNTNDSTRSFLDDADAVSLADSSADHETASVADSDSPRTPQDTTFRPFSHAHTNSNSYSASAPASRRPSNQHHQDSLERLGLRPHIVHYGSENLFSPGREMTLKMTLTRPDLRTDMTHAGSINPTAQDPPPPPQSAPGQPRKPSVVSTLGVGYTGDMHRGVDPFRLESLPLSDERNPIWESLPPVAGDGERGLKKLWRRFGGKTAVR